MVDLKNAIYELRNELKETKAELQQLRNQKNSSVKIVN